MRWFDRLWPKRALGSAGGERGDVSASEAPRGGAWAFRERIFVLRVTGDWEDAGQRALPLLVEALCDPDAAVRQAAAEEVGNYGPQVREVIRVSEITRVPQAPSHVRGVANLRGRILAVVELRSRLGLPPAEPTARARVVVVEVRDRVLGLLVDAVSQVTKVPRASVVPAPDEVLSGDSDYVTGVARWQSRLIILLDLEKALAPTE